MPPAKKPRGGPVNVRLVDLPANLEHKFQFSPDIGFPRFLSLLTEVSAQVAQHIEGVARRPSQEKGFTTSEGPWWYRIARPDGSYKPADQEDDGNTANAAWRVLNTSAAYDILVAEMSLGVDPEVGWVEVEHTQQKTRDEQVLQEASLGLALVKDTVRAGYDSRITSGEFQDVEENPEVTVNREVVFHHRDLSDVTEVPVQPLSGYLHLQPNSAPQTPCPLPNPLFDPSLQGLLTGNSLPVEGTSSNFSGGGNTAHHVIVTATGQTIVSPFPESSPAIPDSDHLLGATALYESRETKVHLPTVVDSSLIREADTSDNFTMVQTGPALTTSQAAQGHYQNTHSPYPYGPHGNFAPFGSFPPQEVEGLHSALAQGHNRHQGPPQGIFSGRQHGGQGRVSVPNGSINRWNPAQRRGQRDGQDRNNATGNTNRGKGYAKANNNNNNPPPSRGAGTGGRGGYQNYRGQNGWSHGQSRNHAMRGPDQPSMERANPPFQRLLPPAESGLASRPSAQYPLMIQPHMHPTGYQFMMPLGQRPPSAYGYGPQYHYPPPDQDWASIPGVNTDLMTESEIISLNRQRFGHSNVHTSTANVASATARPATSTPLTLTEAAEFVLEGKTSVLTEPEKSNGPMQVRGAQTALDVTVTDPYLIADAKNGANKAPVTKFPDSLSFGTAPHVKPMNFRNPEKSPASAAAALKRKATRRSNQEKAKVKAEEDRAAEEEMRSKQSSSRAARAQKHGSMICGDDT
ncbi:uncharacterized protein A1O9_10067 [Exophiala aquamarina CBS 119918]|uniref:Uncharacterized protein n=1 Tax=Exophiala aquamarina CBS 119918 TaxID=1182545 RepID=A0A072P1U8_9EURO|nr:uncharacterized protein A1O9_10067 [Exophiala aquamarina CBS 119918]KEF53667.1 hypothetical protein A1O9_10067 [Exophiala aquamarina CBS 119918]